MKYLICSLIYIFIMHNSNAQFLPLYQNVPNQIASPNMERQEFDGILRVYNVTHPSYQYYRVKEDHINRPCVVICPGGGYGMLAAGHEGTDVAAYFNSIGINAIILKYRIPNDKYQIDRAIAPLQDVQQAMYLARTNADQWGIDAHKIGVMGFSAGGHLAASLSSHYMDVKIENSQQVSLRPDFQILIYPVITFQEFGHNGSTQNLIGKHPTQDQILYYSNELQVTENTPAAFIVHAEDDNVVPVKNAVIYGEALRNHHVASELLLMEKGGHGFGMKNKQSEIQWPPILEAWLHKIKVL